MSNRHPHKFHIPVMGTGFTIDTPVKVARYGITSVVSIGDDELCEIMREYYSKEFNKPFEPIKKWDDDSRARRITAYLNLLNEIVTEQFDALRNSSFDSDSEIRKYFQMLPSDSPLKLQYLAMQELSEGPEKEAAKEALRRDIRPGDIEVNIMTKIDKTNMDREGNELDDIYSDALSGLRGYAKSDLDSGIVFSAGFNRRLYAYVSQFDDFFPDENGYIKKRVILKVSDFRSSLTQGKFLAKKGIWISEHRIESGLNCGGHAFATDGYLMGPILEEFKQKRTQYQADMLALCNKSLKKVNRYEFKSTPELRVTVQGGIGTAKEQQFLFDYYKVQGTGWATPFLLVPEATTLDYETRKILRKAEKKDLFLSGISPLGVPFNSVHHTASEKQRDGRIENAKPGSPCPKGYLKLYNREFTDHPVCLASTFYQRKKLKSLGYESFENDHTDTYKEIVQKTCLCEDLAAGALVEYGIESKRPQKTAVCPGPNLAYFDKISTLVEMVGHIYGRINLLNEHVYRSNMFVNELVMYVDYFKSEFKKKLPHISVKDWHYFEDFKKNLQEGVEYYRHLVPKLKEETQTYREKMREELDQAIHDLEMFFQPYVESLKPQSA